MPHPSSGNALAFADGHRPKSGVSKPERNSAVSSKKGGALMKVFIGWSGDRSKVVARALREWMPRVIQSAEPWMSDHDIQAGDRWADRLNRELQETRFGVAVMTRENLDAQWIHFEAGALAKQVGESSVCPYLVDIESASELTGPLTQFQARRADEQGTLELMKRVNDLGDNKLSSDALVDTFTRFWGDLEGKIKSLPSSAVREPQRTDRELLEEILERVRSLGRRVGGMRVLPAARALSPNKSNLSVSLTAPDYSAAAAEVAGALERYLAARGLSRKKGDEGDGNNTDRFASVRSSLG